MASRRGRKLEKAPQSVLDEVLAKIAPILRNRKIIGACPDDSAHLVPTDGVLRGAPWRTTSRIGHDGASRTIHRTPRHAAHIVARKSLIARPDAGRASFVGAAGGEHAGVTPSSVRRGCKMASIVIGSRWRNRAHASAGQTIRAAARIWPWLQHSAARLTAPRKASKPPHPRPAPGPCAHVWNNTQRRTGAVAGHLAPDLSPAAQLDAAAESSVLSQQGLLSRA